ncbi:MAG: VOC family protein [Gaiellaceae bacterium]
MESIEKLYPFLSVRDVGAAVDFYREAFGALEVAERLHAPDGNVVAQLEIGGQPVGLATERPDLQTPSPETVGGTTVRIRLDVDDPDGAQARAIAAGAREMFPVADQPYGMRQGRVVDPFGHHWLLGRELRAEN